MKLRRVTKKIYPIATDFFPSEIERFHFFFVTAVTHTPKLRKEYPMSKKTDRLIEALKASARQDGEKDAETRAKIRAALVKTLEKLLDQMTEHGAAELFADIEDVAPASAAKLIRRHDLRPDATDGILADRVKNKPLQGKPSSE